MIDVTVRHLLIFVIEFLSLSFILSLSHSHTYSTHCLSLPHAHFSFLFTLSLLPVNFHPPLYFLLSDLDDACQLQLSHVVTLVALSMAAPQAMASTITMWCASPVTKAIHWKDPPQPSARPAASGASSRQHAEVRSSNRAPTEWIYDWQLGWL